MHLQRYKNGGVGIIAVLLIISMLSVIGAVITSIVAAGAVAKTNDLVREQAFALAHAGFEYALKRADEGTNPNGNIKNLGNGQFSISYANGGLITVSSNVSAMFGSAAMSYTIQGPAVQSMSTCLTINTAAAALYSSGTSLQGITLQNTCNVALTITGMTVSWSPDSAERMSAIYIGGVQVYNNPSGVVSGAAVTLSPSAVLAACSSGIALRIDFNSNMAGKNVTMVFTLSDASTKSAFVQLAADNEAACLNVDTSAMAVGFTGSVRLLNGTLINSCSGNSVRIDSMTVSWTPVTPARTRSSISIGGTVRWSGSAGSGVTSALSSQVTINASSSVVQDYINFDSDMRGYNYTIVYTMRDATTKSVTVNLYEANPNACLTVNTGGTSYSGNNLIGQTWQNTCALRIVVDQVQTSWTPTTPNRRWAALQVNGVVIFSGASYNSGTTVNISNIDIPGSTTYPVNYYQFNNSMTGRCVSHRMTMFPDSGFVNVAQYCP